MKKRHRQVPISTQFIRVNLKELLFVAFIPMFCFCLVYGICLGWGVMRYDPILLGLAGGYIVISFITQFIKYHLIGIHFQ